MTTRGGYAKGHARRAQIVAAAFDAFRAQGFHGASLLQIAEAVGISRTGLLHHFDSKEDLLAAVLAERDRRDGEAFFGDEADEPGAVDYLDRLGRLIAHNMKNPQIVELFVVLSAEATDPHHPAHVYFRDRYQRVCGYVTDAIRDLADRGLLQTPRTPEDLAAELVALLDGSQVQWLYCPEQIDPATRYRRWVEAIVIGTPA